MSVWHYCWLPIADTDEASECLVWRIHHPFGLFRQNDLAPPFHKSFESRLLMKQFLFIFVPLLAAFIGWLAWDAGSDIGESRDAPVAVTWDGAAPTLTMADSDEIFKKAFWRRSSSDDEILHAERYEWSDEEGLLRWQWFLVVKASPGLITYLRDDNAFGLVPASKKVRLGQAPAWFDFDPEDVNTLQAPLGGMSLFFSKTSNILYATAFGRGFTKGAPEPAPAVQGAPAPGRIPNTPPPRPK
jgi:hypothetical protein